MQQEYDDLTREEKLKAENDFLKMKMMLEKGAEFGGMSNTENFTPEMENIFLKNILDFETQLENAERITIFDRIGKPGNFKAAAESADAELEIAWIEVNALLNKNGITLDCCSPNISKRELYRFITEELFLQEVDKISLPGWYSTFIYDEFHPDPFYENTTEAVQECIHILGNEKMKWVHNFQKENLRLNEHYPLSENEFRDIVNQFKEAYDSLKILEVKDNFCRVDEKESLVKGIYSIEAVIGKETLLLAGNWWVKFILNDEIGYWYITEVQIEGIKF
ncbi:MAG: hypothetical protein ABJA78_02595 [Ferruginibacter sp.]